MKDKTARYQMRKRAIQETMEQISSVMSAPVTVEKIEKAKAYLLALAAQKSLFPYEDFPIKEDEVEATYCLSVEEDGHHALYAYHTLKGGVYHPHDHGRSWAIVAAVDGAECHHLYERNDKPVSEGPACEGPASLDHKGHIIVEPGTAISLLEGGVHSIEDVNQQPFLHLHCYGLKFAQQDARLEYDLESKMAFHNNNVGEILYLDEE